MNGVCVGGGSEYREERLRRRQDPVQRLTVPLIQCTVFVNFNRCPAGTHLAREDGGWLLPQANLEKLLPSLSRFGEG